MLPVLISALPLKEDMEEAETVYGCLCNLILASHAEVYYHILMTSFIIPRLCQHLLVILGMTFGEELVVLRTTPSRSCRFLVRAPRNH